MLEKITMIQKHLIKHVGKEPYSVWHSNAGHEPGTVIESSLDKYGMVCDCTQYKKYHSEAPCVHIKDVWKFIKSS